MSDAECVANVERCRSPVNGCTSSCDDDQQCPAPRDGTAVQRCESVFQDNGDGSFSQYGACVLGCHGDLACPTGMVCGAVLIAEVDFTGENGLDVDPMEIEVCVWP